MPWRERAREAPWKAVLRSAQWKKGFNGLVYRTDAEMGAVAGTQDVIAFSFSWRSGISSENRSNQHHNKPGQRTGGQKKQERPGVTCLPITGSGAVFIRGSSVGVEKVFGKNSWKF